jgi:hypothetical protein
MRLKLFACNPQAVEEKVEEFEQACLRSSLQIGFLFDFHP